MAGKPAAHSITQVLPAARDVVGVADGEDGEGVEGAGGDGGVGRGGWKDSWTTMSLVKLSSAGEGGGKRVLARVSVTFLDSPPCA